MKGLNVVCSLIFLASLLRESHAGEAESNGVYIVYMGAAAASRDSHNLLVSSLIRRKRNAVVHNYRNAFLGFAARLTKTEAQDIARKPGVVSVFPDPLFKLHTTRSWDFLKYQTGVEVDFRSSSTYTNSVPNTPSDIIIGVLDTGIWPESESFNDDGFGPIPSKWKGTCMQSDDFTTKNCNRKIIGARYYKGGSDFNTSRDKNGHGTHVASTAAGNAVSNASYYGLATGSAKGGFPGARIAMYKVCGVKGCLGSAIMGAFDDAIKDGVDVLSLSLGASAGYGPNFQNDPIAIGAFHAVEKGITVVCSAGNDGPGRETAVNIAPWILTVAASSIDRDFQADITLGDKTVIKGGGINFGNIQRSPVYPLLYGNLAKRNNSSYDESDARNCVPRSLDANKVKGCILLCENEDGVYTAKEKLAFVKLLGATGMILISDEARAVASSYGSFPMASVDLNDGSKIVSYLNTTRNPTATILPTVSVTEYKPAPVVPYFSARGPSFAAKDIIKPDVAAPGVAILASWPENDSVVTLGGKSSPRFYIISGTSMACPHVSGLAAMIKSQNPNWSPSAIKSAMMTTASQTNNMKKPITTNSGTDATPYDFGAGEVSSSPLQPGLIYETGTIHYLLFLCGVGYDITTIKLISSTVPPDFSCPNKSVDNSVSDMNYPSIAVSKLTEKESRQVSRTVTNVDGGETTYTVSVETPTGLEVKVTPNTLRFTESNKQLTYQVTFTSNGNLPEDNFGSITWSNGKYKVRSPFVVSSS
ncbi:CO(2)-response secreted protease isoform X1 [Cynara cardunculus var. scolymus]|uniref:CO(2)-response secreted protease isoform X1 n=1 Tax=Cynara cardunculus var. scolymus TaxID=59895 RepID=UPI000D62DCDB|nr:CO(2)-response secreted protease isoform X1 [Cynara cardunculus var. scolymus]